MYRLMAMVSTFFSSVYSTQDVKLCRQLCTSVVYCLSVDHNVTFILQNISIKKAFKIRKNHNRPEPLRSKKNSRKQRLTQLRAKNESKSPINQVIAAKSFTVIKFSMWINPRKNGYFNGAIQLCYFPVCQFFRWVCFFQIGKIVKS